jgi:hypothetical protein
MNRNVNIVKKGFETLEACNVFLNMVARPEAYDVVELRESVLAGDAKIIGYYLEERDGYR